MTLTMADDIYASNLPPGYDAYAGYVNGNWPDYNAIVARFPNAKHLSISVYLADRADCLDIETGDATPAQAPVFVDERIAAGVYRPCLYSSISQMPQVVAALGNRARQSYRLWSAHYNHQSHICGPTTCRYLGDQTPQCDGTQWDSYSNYDVSLLSDDFFAPDPPIQEFQVFSVIEDKTGVKSVWTIGTDGHVYRCAQSGPDGAYGAYTMIGSTNGTVTDLLARYSLSGIEEAYIQFQDASTYTTWRQADGTFAGWTRIGV